MGIVYKAENVKLGRFVELNFLPENIGKDLHALMRFQREAKARRLAACVCARRLCDPDHRVYVRMEILVNAASHINVR
jgi:hypothetical protein